MTDQKLIKMLRYCHDKESCENCRYWGVCEKTNEADIADRLEALLAENERLKAQVPKWVSTKERLPVLTERETQEIEKFGVEWAPEFIVLIKDAAHPTTLMFDGEKWVDNDGNWYSVTRWMAIPSAEEVEE